MSSNEFLQQKLGRTVKLTEEEEITKKAYDKYGKVWASRNYLTDFWDEDFKRLKRLLPSGEILEIGSGSGRDAKDLIAMGYGYTGTDITDSFLDITRKNFPHHKFYRLSVYDLSKLEKSFDGFWACAVLLHVPKERMDEALQSIKSVMKPGAIGFISLKTGTGEKVRDDIIGPVKMRRFFSYWDKGEFSKVLKKNKFEIVGYAYRPMSEDTNWHCFFVKAK